MYPHELSGGMKQRIGMAIAVALRPQVIIADEPTSALDVVVQKRVMDTLFRVQQELDAAVILVGHDMGLMAQCVDRIGVMYAGRLAELGPVQSLLEEPLHPYNADVGRKPAVAGAQGRVSRHSWTAALAAGAAAGMSLPPALSAGDEPLLGSLTEVGRSSCRASGGLSLARRGLRQAQPRCLVNTPLLEARGASRAFGGGVFDRQQIVAVADALAGNPGG